MIFLRLLAVLIFFVSYTKEFNDIAFAQVNSCKTDFEENLERLISKNNHYKELLKLTGLANSSAANQGLMILLSEDRASKNTNPYVSMQEHAKICKKNFDSFRKKYNDFNFTIETVLGNSSKMKDINFWNTFFRTESNIVFFNSKNDGLKRIYYNTQNKIVELRKNNKKPK